jgi:hypothetical protein
VMLAEIAAHEKECHRVINGNASGKPKTSGKSAIQHATKKSASARSKQTD